MLSQEALNVYLNDHLAGSVAAVDLIEQALDRNKGTELGVFLQQLLDDVRADQGALQRLMEQFDVEKSGVKQATSWAAEKFSRLKFMTTGRTSEGLRNLLELEALLLGVGGKRSLWLSLKAASEADSRLEQADLDALIKRAEDQISGIEQHRDEAARQGLTE
jgi:flagellar hook-basal body complex protein FliE